MKRLNCDVFMVEGTRLDGNVCITGNFYMEKDCIVTGKIDAGESVILSDNDVVAYVRSETPENPNKDISYKFMPCLGKNITAGGDVISGDCCWVGKINAIGKVLLGENSNSTGIKTESLVHLVSDSCSGDIEAGGDVILENNISVGNIKTYGSVSMENNNVTQKIDAQYEVRIKGNAYTGAITVHNHSFIRFGNK